MLGEGDNPKDVYARGVDVDVSDLDDRVESVYDSGTYEWARPVSKVWERTALSKAIGEYVANQRADGRIVTVRSEAVNNLRELTFKDTGMRLIYLFKDKHLKKARKVLREESLFILPTDITDCIDRVIAFPYAYTSITTVCELDRYNKEDVNEKLRNIESIVAQSTEPQAT